MLDSSAWADAPRWFQRPPGAWPRGRPAPTRCGDNPGDGATMSYVLRGGIGPWLGRSWWWVEERQFQQPRAKVRELLRVEHGDQRTTHEHSHQRCGDDHRHRLAHRQRVSQERQRDPRGVRYRLPGMLAVAVPWCWPGLGSLVRRDRRVGCGLIQPATVRARVGLRTGTVASRSSNRPARSGWATLSVIGDDRGRGLQRPP